MKTEELKDRQLTNDEQKKLHALKSKYLYLGKLINEIETGIKYSENKDSSLVLSFFRNISFSTEQIKIRRNILIDIATLTDKWGIIRINDQDVQASLLGYLEKAINASKTLQINQIELNDKKITFKNKNGKQIDRKVIDNKELKNKIKSGEIGTDQHLFLMRKHKEIKDAIPNKLMETRSIYGSQGNTSITDIGL